MKLVGERRALAALVLSFYFVLYLIQALMGDDLARGAMYSLAGVYGLALFAIVAGYFWARWYAVGVGLWGIIVSIVATWQLKTLEPIIVFLGATHLFVAVSLWGAAMAESFDGQQAWRQKFHMDDNAVQRLGRSVIRAGVMLPFILLYAFGPKPEAHEVVTYGALALAVFGFRGLVQLKTWGIVAMGLAGVMLLGQPSHTVFVDQHALSLPAWPIALLLLSAAAPFVKPMARFVGERA